MSLFKELKIKIRTYFKVKSRLKWDNNSVNSLTQDNSDWVVVVRNDAIGDYLLFRPFIKSIKQIDAFKDKKLLLVANPLWSNLASEMDGQWIDKIVTVDFNSFNNNREYRSQILKEWLSKSYFAWIYPLHTKDTLLEISFLNIKATYKIAQIGEQKHQSKFVQKLMPLIYTHLLPTQHQVQFELLTNASFCLNLGRIFKPDYQVHYSYQIPEFSYLQNYPKPYLVLFPGASAKLKRWDTINFVKVADVICELYPNFQLVIAGSPQDEPYQMEILNSVQPKTKEKITPLCGKTSLTELATLIRFTDLLITNDTVAMHFAALQNVPLICVLMGENPGKFAPYPKEIYSGGVYLYPPDIQIKVDGGDYSENFPRPDIQQITPERVIFQVNELLNPKH